MTTRADVLADSILTTKPLFTRFLQGFDDTTSMAQPPGLPNHAVWTLGHCAFTMDRISERFDGNPLSGDMFVRGDGTQGDAQRFDTESVCIGSLPHADASLYPPLARGLEIFEASCERFAAAVRGASDEKLDEGIPWHDGEMSHWALIMRVCFHNGTHAGQITDTRRALGMPPIIAGA